VAVVGGGVLGLGRGGLLLEVPLASPFPPPYKGRPLPGQVGVGVWVPTQTPPLLPNLEEGVRVRVGTPPPSFPNRPRGGVLTWTPPPSGAAG
jgi:hypothetical protein